MAMAGFKGADVELLKGFGGKLDGKAQTIESVISAVEGMVHNELPAIWKGPDADKFAQIWQNSVKSALKRAAEELRNAGSDAKRNADKQDQTSASY